MVQLVQSNIADTRHCSEFKRRRETKPTIDCLHKQIVWWTKVHIFLKISYCVRYTEWVVDTKQGESILTNPWRYKIKAVESSVWVFSEIQSFHVWTDSIDFVSKLIVELLLSPPPVCTKVHTPPARHASLRQDCSMRCWTKKTQFKTNFILLHIADHILRCSIFQQQG